MSAWKLVLSAVAVAELASAQFSSNPCSSTSTRIINTTADAQALSSCTTYTGNIALSSDLSGSVSFDGIQTLKGDLVGRNASGVVSISANDLKRISGDFVLAGLTTLSDIEFPSLLNIDGSLNWESIPNLGGFNFGAGVQRIGQVIIFDTQIQDLSRINLKAAQSVKIGQNSRLNKLSWQLQTVGDVLNLDTNGGGSGFEATFGNLESAGAISINQVTSLSVDSLKNVSGAFSIINAPLKTLSAPNLTTVGFFEVRDNPNLNNISAPMLKNDKGGFNIQRNDALTGNVTFPALTNIDGAINSTGSFDELLFPQLNNVKGAVRIVSTGSLTRTCNAITSDRASNVIHVKPVCSGKSQQSGTTSGSGSGSGSDASTTSSSAAMPGVISSYPVSLFGSTGLLAVMLGLL